MESGRAILPTDNEEEELSESGRADEPEVGRRKAMSADPTYTSEYYESKDDEGKEPAMRRQPPPEHYYEDSPSAGGRRYPTRKKPKNKPVEEVASILRKLSRMERTTNLRP